MDFGAWEGKGYQDLQGDENYQRWIDSGGTLPFPEGESREAFGQRCLEGLRLCKNHMEVLLKDKANRAQTETICLGANAVVHGGTIMAVMSHLTGQDYFTFQVENGWGFTLCFDVTEEVPTEEMATGEVATGSFRWTLLSWEPTI
jgi:alpha-ribazole phosphatase